MSLHPGLLNILNNKRCCRASTGAHRRAGIAATSAFQLIDSRHDDADAGHTYRMSQRNAGAIGIYFIQGNLQFPVNSQELCGKSLVEFPVINVIDLKAGKFKGSFNRRHYTHSHDSGLHRTGS